MKKLSKIITISFITMGGVSISAQIILLRELLSAFYGNELSIGIILAAWLIIISAGSLLSAKLSDRITRKLEIFAATLMLLALSLPATLFLARTTKHMMGLMPGEIIGFSPAFCLSLIALSFFCLPYGFLFPLGARIISQFHTKKAKGPASAYFLEAVGTIAGGTLTSFMLINILAPFEIIFILSISILIVAALILWNITGKTSAFLRYTPILLLTFCVISWIFGIPKQLEKLSEHIMWRPFSLIKTENSIYGNVATVSEKNQLNFYINGGFAFSFPDNAEAEETVHYAMSLHPKAQTVLLIGGGLNGALAEVYKYNPRKVDYVEINPSLIETAKSVIGEKIKTQLSDSALRIHQVDGRFYVKNTHDRYDVILLAVPPPRTIQVNRFYTKEFFIEIQKILNKNGILSIGCEGNENYIGPKLAEYLGTIHGTLTAAGFQVNIIPGENIKFIASKNKIINISARSLQAALDARGIKTIFVHAYYLSDRLSPEKADYIKKIVEGVKNPRINTDFNPISYYYDMVLWAKSFQPAFDIILKTLNKKILWVLVGGICFFIVFFGSEKKTFTAPIIIAVATTGFAQIALELNIMLAFQALYGYLYYKLGIIMTSFMAGLFTGSLVITKNLDHIKNASLSFKKSKIALSLFAFFLILIFKALSNHRSFYLSEAGTLFIFPMLVFITGALGGIQFALASGIMTKNNSEVGGISGVLYSSDLIGGVAGALFLSAVLIPIIGIFQCTAAVGIINLTSALMIRHRPC